MSPSLSRRELAVLALGALALATVMSWPLVLHLGSDIPKDLGDPLLQAWQVAWIGHALLRAPLDLWQANTFWPYEDTLAFTDALIGYAPAALFAQASPAAALVTYNLLFLLAYALAFAGAYLLARELGLRVSGAVVTGVAFAYAPWKLTQNGHLHVLSSGGIPLALFLLVRGYRRGNPWTVLAGWLVAAWQMTLGFTLGLQFAYLLGALAVGVGIALATKAVRRPARAVVVASLAGALVFSVVVALVAQPYLRVIDEHDETRRTPAYVQTFSPKPRSFLAAPVESWLWGDVTARARASLPAPHEASFFPGAVVSVLVLLGALGSAFPRRLRAGLVLGVVVCAVLSLGVRDVEGLDRYVTPFRLLFDFAPGWDGVRTPGRINVLTSLGLALLAGAGWCVVAGALTRSRGRAVATVAAFAAVAVILLEGLGPLTHVPVPEPPSAVREEADPQLNLPARFHTDLLYSYWSTAGFPRTVNGAGAIDPQAYDTLRKEMADFPDQRSVRLLRGLGVRTVLFHPGVAAAFGTEDIRGRPIAGLGIDRERVGDVVVFRLR